jgi:hypothetical protein
VPVPNRLASRVNYAGIQAAIDVAQLGGFDASTPLTGQGGGNNDYRNTGDQLTIARRLLFQRY